MSDSRVGAVKVHDSEEPRRHNAIVRVVLVEDTIGDVRRARGAFEQCRETTALHVATEGQGALDLLFQRGWYAGVLHPGIVLLDLNLPRKNAREVLAEIKRGSVLRRTRMAILTTSRAEDDTRQTCDLRADCYLTEPGSREKPVELVGGLECFRVTAAILPGLD